MYLIEGIVKAHVEEQMNWANIAVSLGMCQRARTAERYVCPLNEATGAPALVDKQGGNIVSHTVVPVLAIRLAGQTMGQQRTL
jgi:hypothetical protein